MKKQKNKIYAIFILITESIGALSGFLSRSGMELYSTTINQPPLSPPSILFPIVWGVLYALMGFGAARIYIAEPSTGRSRGINLYITQLVVNFFWSLIFFNAQAFGFAFLWLLLLIVLVALILVVFAAAVVVGVILMKKMKQQSQPTEENKGE